MELILTKEHTEQIAKLRCERLIAENKRLRDALEEIAKETEVYFNGGGLGESLFIIAKQALEQSND